MRKNQEVIDIQEKTVQDARQATKKENLKK